MKKLFILCLLLMLSVNGFAAGTNFLWSANTTSNAIYTNIVGVSNLTFTIQTSNTAYMVSNAVWSITNGVVAATNVAVIVPDSKTNWLRFTNGTLRGITNNIPQ